MKLFTRIRKSKTMVFSMILSAIGVIQASTEFLSTLMTAKAFGLFTLIVGIIVAILRVVTTQPLADK